MYNGGGGRQRNRVGWGEEGKVMREGWKCMINEEDKQGYKRRRRKMEE